ncbi:MAG TPA: IS4 family transposase [Chitinophagaceae bacterium]|nr:IS4 family transposase [Chitinophagaceae bacterium]
MGKSTFFTGQPVLNQLIHLIPRQLVNQLSQEYKSDHYYKKFRAFDHLVTMLYCGFYRCSSLRELVTGLQANSYRLFHLGLKYTPRRSTLADANKKRSSDFFEALFHKLYRHHYGILPDSLKGSRLRDKLFVVDSTTISTFCEVMKGAGNYGLNGKKKGGVKAHTLMRMNDQVPCFIYLTEAKKNDRTIMPILQLPANSVLVMDKGYLSLKVMDQWTKEKISWVTRLYEGAVYELAEKRAVGAQQRSQGVRSDLRVILGNPRTEKNAPLQTARIINFYDADKKRKFVFLTNNMQYSPLTIANIYKQRWSIENLFRRVKGNFQFHNFLGDNENAIRIQLWCTLIADLLISIVKAKVDRARKRKWAFANIAGLIRHHLTSYIDLFKFLINPERALIQYAHEITPTQLLLFRT